ncbi:MAG: hypothetical protein DSY42_04375 [Aquifex sp.]|nr:MAG: hypothetical protein DSY42_04375 [Aquifex sp.]
MNSVKFLEKLEKINSEELNKLIENKETFVLYIRSEKLYDKIKEIFDVDVIFPELAKNFEGVKFIWGDIDELKEFKGMVPSVLIFKEGKQVERIDGIKTWAEYVGKIREALSC